MSQLLATNKQVPEHSIMDIFWKQAYLGNQFVYAVGDMEITQTSEYPLFWLQNPPVSATAFPSGWQTLFVNIAKIACLTASQSAILRVYLNPTGASGGTTETPLNVRPGNTEISSIASLALSPSSSGNGSIVETLCAQPGLPDKISGLYILDPGNSMLVTAQTSSDTTYIGSSIGWYQI